MPNEVVAYLESNFFTLLLGIEFLDWGRFLRKCES